MDEKNLVIQLSFGLPGDTKAYDIHYIEFEFTNGWNIKETSNAFIDFHTNSVQERNELQKN